MPLTPPDREALRHAALGCLAARHPAALPLAGITRRLRTELDFPVDSADVSSALEFLKDSGLVDSLFDDLGSTLYYRATANGLKSVERSPS